jgi:hypothetical protein
MIQASPTTRTAKVETNEAAENGLRPNRGPALIIFFMQESRCPTGCSTERFYYVVYVTTSKRFQTFRSEGN